MYLNAEMIKAGILTAGNGAFYVPMETTSTNPIKIGGFNVTENSFYSGKATLDSYEAGVYLGTDGIHIG
jgi:hypothetical protein